MPTYQMKIAKATEKDIQSTIDFLHMAEELLERDKFSLESPEHSWKGWDEEDDDYILAKKMQAEIAEEEGISPESVDDRIVAFEILRRKFARASSAYGRVLMAAEVLIEEIVPASSTILEYHPGFEFNHVDKEQ